MDTPCFYRVSVKALITDGDGRFLLARESDGAWDFLGGGLEHNEDPIAALKREIPEETGLVVTDVSNSPAYFVTAKKPNMDVFMANLFYPVTVQDLQFTPSDECQELRYFSSQEARQVHLLPNVEAFLGVYNSDLHR